MKYKITPGTAIWDQLAELKKKAKEVDDAARALVKDVGGKRYCYSSNHSWGGIAAIEFETPPDGWKKVGKPYLSLYYPKATNKGMLNRINELPVVTKDEFNAILGFNGPQTVSSERGLLWVSTPGIEWYDEYILITLTNNAKWETPEGVQEIVESEYLKLSAKEDQEVEA